MSITIKKDAWRIKDDNGVYRSADLFSTMLPSEAKTLVAETQVEFTNMQNQLMSLAASKTQEITNEGSTQVTAVNTKGQEVLASIPHDYTTASHAVDAILQGGFIYNAANGDVANFDDGADEMLIKSLVANIEPQQDLHGYDSPWPAGGGKNLIPYSRGPGSDSGLSYTPQDDGGLKIEGTLSSSYSIYNFYQDLNGLYFTPGETYRFTIEPEIAGINLQLYVDDVSTWVSANKTYTIPSDATKVYLRIRISYNSALDTVFYPMAMLASNTDTSWVPYSNLCPISGWTELNGVRTGNNLCETPIAGYSLNASGALTGSPSDNMTINSATPDYMPVTAGKHLTFSWDNTVFPTISTQVYVYDSEKVFTGIRFASGAVSSGAFTTSDALPDGAAYIRVRFFLPSGNTHNQAVLDSCKFMCNYGETALQYEPYINSLQISVNWQSIAGTVYGGTIALNSDRTGMLTANRVITTITSVDKVNSVRGYCSVGIGDKDSVRDTYGISNILKWSDDISSEYDCFRIQNSTANKRDQIAIRFSGDRSSSSEQTLAYTNNKLAELSTAGTPLQVVYELVEPIQYPLTESAISGVLTTLYGINNIWVDTGDVTVTYPVDTKTYIDRKIQEAIDGLSGS